MSELAQETFQVTFKVTVSAHDIAGARAAKTRQRFHRAADDDGSWIDDYEARDRQLLAALCATPDLLRAFCLLQTLWSIDDLFFNDDTYSAMKQALPTDVQLVEALRDKLSEPDFSHLHDVAEEDVFLDNTSFFQDAFTVRQHSLRVEHLAEGGSDNAGDDPGHAATD